VASAYTDALRLLAGRELSAAEVRARLLNREHAAVDVDAAIERLQQHGSLDDNRVARAYARTAIDVKGRGRLRIARELHEKGISKDVISAALAEVFGELDERSLVARAIQKKLRGRSRPANAAEYARLYQHLMRQGFSPAVVSTELRRTRGGRDEED
jgi:regulatory protein